METLRKRLAALFRVLVEEAEANPSFAAKLDEAIGTAKPVVAVGSKKPAEEAPRRSNRRAKPLVDPFAILPQGEAFLRAELQKLDVEQLKDVVAEYGMDTSRLALKWKLPERLVDLIVTTVLNRSRKGDVFRDGPGKQSSPLGATVPTAGHAAEQPPSP